MKLRVKANLYVGVTATPNIDELEALHKELRVKYPQKGYAPIHIFGDILVSYLRTYEAFYPEWNAIKKVMDKAYDEKDYATFASELAKAKELAYNSEAGKILHGATKRLSQTKRPFKIDTPAKNFLLSQLSFMYNSIKNGQVWLDRSKLSPAELARRDKQSVQMQMRWGL